MPGLNVSFGASYRLPDGLGGAMRGVEIRHLRTRARRASRNNLGIIPIRRLEKIDIIRYAFCSVGIYRTCSCHLLCLV